MRYALLDRDGTIIVEKNYLRSIDQLELLPDAVAGLRLLASKGFGLIVVTNQSGVGRGILTVDDVEAIHGELKARLEREGVAIAGFYYCPHAPSEGCACRKPRLELAQRAAADFGFVPAEAVVIGDKKSDIDFGRAMGARTILVRTGYGLQHESTAGADLVAGNLKAAAASVE